MAKCPKCGVTLLEDSGLVTCHACGAIVIIDEDGNPIVDDGAPRAPEPVQQIERIPVAAPAPTAHASSSHLTANLSSHLSTPSSPAKASSKVNAPLDPLDYLGGLDQPQTSNQTFNQPYSQPFEQTQSSVAIDPALVEEPSSFEPAQSYSDNFAPVNPDFSQSADSYSDQVNSASLNSNQGELDSAGFPMNPDFADLGGYDPDAPSEFGMVEPIPVSQEPQDVGTFEEPDFFENGIHSGGGQLSEEDPLGLNAFANSEVSAANDGMLVCRIYIDGIDTKEIRANLRAAMDDQRFNWDLNVVLSHLKNGQLVIEKITPVKAMVLIKRIKQMPIRIRWEQYTIADVEDEPDASQAHEYDAN